MKFLVVEDDPIARKLMNYYLSNYGEIQEFQDGKLAINALRSTVKEHIPFDIVFIDIMMPGIDGYKVLETIQELRRNDQVSQIKAIMVSSYNDWDTIHKSYQKGCDGYIMKPVTQEKIQRVLVKIGCPCVDSSIKLNL